MKPARTMTTDVIDRPAAVLPEIPAWVPPHIADCGREVLAKADPDWDCVPILTRLLVDARMRAVWSQLTQKRRADGRFQRPSLLERGADAVARQYNAIWVLLHGIAFTRYVSPQSPVARLRRDADRIRIERQQLARRLREEAASQEAVERYHRLVRAEKLKDAAETLDEIAAEEAQGSIIVERDRGNLEAHGLAILIATLCQYLFGPPPLWSVTATLTSVALDCEVSAEQVRNWWRAK